MFDPCGTRRLEGDDIIKRLAEYLQVSPEDLAVALKVKVLEIQHTEKKIREDGGCGCGD